MWPISHLIALFLFLSISCFLSEPVAAQYSQYTCQSVYGAPYACTYYFSSECGCGYGRCVLSYYGPTCCYNSATCQYQPGDCRMFTCGLHPNCAFAYTPWACSTSCGVGNYVRTKTCPSSAHIAKGNSCEMGGTIEIGGPCQAGLQWSGWSAWSQCSDPTCGGSETRVRSCQCGDNCPGLSQESRPCAAEIGSSWSAWSSSSCSAALCGTGVITATRSCGPCPTVCSGSSIMTTPCHGTAGNIAHIYIYISGFILIFTNFHPHESYAFSHPCTTCTYNTHTNTHKHTQTKTPVFSCTCTSMYTFFFFWCLVFDTGKYPTLYL